MGKVSIEVWKEKADNLTKWREKRTTPPNLDLYKNIVEMVNVGRTVLDVGAGQCHLKECLPSGVDYIGIDPFPVNDEVLESTAEDLSNFNAFFDTVFILSALDNVIDVKKSLEGIKRAARQNVVILTGIDIEPDIYHTHKITRKDLTDVLGEPKQEVEMLKDVYLFEFKV